MDFPKSLARDSLKKKKTSKFPYTLVISLVGLGILLVIARSTSVLNPTNIDVFNPRILPNSSVTYQDKSIIRTTQGIVTYPDMIGSSDRGSRLVQSVSLNGDQTFYIFSSEDRLIVDSKFSRDFKMLKYVTGEGYSFVSGDGLYLKTQNMEYPAKVYTLKTDELVYDYLYDTNEKTFYILTDTESSIRISRIGSFGEQLLYVLRETLVAPSIAHVENGNVYLKNNLDTCRVIDTNVQTETSLACSQMPQNFSGLNYYVQDNAVRRFNVADSSDAIVFQENGISIQEVIQHEDNYVVSYINNITDSSGVSGNSYLFLPALSKSVQLPSEYNVSDFYLIGSIVYITDGKTLLGIDSSVPVSSPTPQWITVIERTNIASLALVY